MATIKISSAELTETIARNIAAFEGYYKLEFSRAWRNNNPGNLRSWGKTPVDSKGYCKFDTKDDGWAALRSQVTKNIKRGLTFREFFGGKPKVYPGFAPQADNNLPVTYAEFVASKVASHFGTDGKRCNIDTVIQSLIDA